MGEEQHEKLISTFFPDDNLVPAYVHCMFESSWKNDKDNMEGNNFCSFVDWDNTSLKPPKSANDTKCVCKKGACVDRSMCLNRNCYAECENNFFIGTACDNQRIMKKLVKNIMVFNDLNK